MATNDTTFNGHMPVSISNSDYTHITKPIQRHGYAGTSGGNNIVTYIECIDCGTTPNFGPDNIVIESYKGFIETVSNLLKNMEERLAQAESTISSLRQTANLAWINGRAHEITSGTLKFNNTSNPNFEGNIILTHIIGDEDDDPKLNISGMIKELLENTDGISNWYSYKYTITEYGGSYSLPVGFRDAIFATNMNGEIVKDWINTPGIYIVGYDESRTSKGNNFTPVPVNINGNQAPKWYDDGSNVDWGDIKQYVNSCINNIIYIITNVGSDSTSIPINQITSITLDKSSLEIDTNGTGTITATVNPSTAGLGKTIQWSSSDTSIATVTASTTSGNPATITWVSAGTVTITASSVNNKTATCQVTCNAANSIPDFINAYYYLGYLGTSDGDINQNAMFTTSLGAWIHTDYEGQRTDDSWSWNTNGITNINNQIGTGDINNGQALIDAIISSNGLECEHSLSSNNDILVFLAPADIIDFLNNNYSFKNNSSHSMNTIIAPVLISDSQTYNDVNYKIIIFNIPDEPISCDSLTCVE